MNQYTNFEFIRGEVTGHYGTDARSVEEMRRIVARAITNKAEFSLRAYRGDDKYSVAACGWTRENGQYVCERDAWLVRE